MLRAVLSDSILVCEIPTDTLYGTRIGQYREQNTDYNQFTLANNALVYVYTPDIPSHLAGVHPAREVCDWLRQGQCQLDQRVQRMVEAERWDAKKREDYVDAYDKTYALDTFFQQSPSIDREEQARRLILHHIPAEAILDQMHKHGVYHECKDGKHEVMLPARIVYPNGYDHPGWKNYQDGVYKATFDKNYVCYHFCFTPLASNVLIEQFIEQGRWNIDRLDSRGADVSGDEQ